MNSRDLPPTKQELEAKLKEAERIYKISIKLWKVVPASDAKVYFFRELQEQKNNIRKLKRELEALRLF